MVKNNKYEQKKFFKKRLYGLKIAPTLYINPSLQIMATLHPRYFSEIQKSAPTYRRCPGSS